MKKYKLGKWQLCPKCLGARVSVTINYVGVPETHVSIPTSCGVCDGKGIIERPIIREDGRSFK